MSILCDTCRPFYSDNSFGLRAKEPGDDNKWVVVSKQTCPMRHILGSGLHDNPLLFNAKFPFDITRLPDCGDKLFLDTGRDYAGYLWLRVPHDSQDHPLQKITSWRTVEPDLRVDSVLKTFQSWLRECDAHHDCTQQGSGTLPTRLLDVGPAQNTSVRLIESRSIACEKYIALSHCWGRGRPLLLTRETYKLFQENIKDSEMPATFRDAVELCRRLKVRYLWIDSLCIIQNDAQDWTLEARAMASVYKEAYLTISASLSASDSDGFLQERPSHQLVATVGIIDKEGVATDVAVQTWNTDEEEDKYTNIVSGIGFVAHDEPISFRAWTMQERFLSRRKLLFCRDQVFWECQRDTCSEDGLSFPTRDFIVNSLWSESAGYQEWYRLLYDYSRCALTYESDVLPALSGLVQQVAQMSPLSSYCAGIWLDDLSRALAWCVHPWDMELAGPPIEKRSYRNRITEQRKFQCKTDRYQAPSFSWASWRGGIQYWYAFRNVESAEEANESDEKYGEYKGKLCTYVHYVSHCLTPHPRADPLNGPFVDGWLRLRGPLLPVSAITLNDADEWFKPDAPLTFTCSLWGDKVIVRGGLDNKDRNKANHNLTTLYILPLHTDVYQQWTTNFLVLERTNRVIEGQTALSRVGVGSGKMKYDDFDNKLFQKIARETALDLTVEEFEERRFDCRSDDDEEKMVLRALADHQQEEIVLV